MLLNFMGSDATFFGGLSEPLFLNLVGEVFELFDHQVLLPMKRPCSLRSASSEAYESRILTHEVYLHMSVWFSFIIWCIIAFIILYRIWKHSITSVFSFQVRTMSKEYNFPSVTVFFSFSTPFLPFLWKLICKRCFAYSFASFRRLRPVLV